MAGLAADVVIGVVVLESLVAVVFRTVDKLVDVGRSLRSLLRR